MITDNEILDRSRLLLGEEVMERMANARVILFGVGGVGSWCAESLVRTGIGHLTIVDSDRVMPSNINRQLMATTETVGEVKVDALRRRLLSIRPEADICARQEIFSAETAADFNLGEYDYIIDAIDSLANKMLLIEMATRSGAKFYSSMGAALKLDPTAIRVAEFWKVEGCPLARALRQRFKRSGRYPARKFLCVYSPELLSNRGVPPVVAPAEAEGDAPGDPSLANHRWDDRKASINGSLMHITAMFGLTLAGLVVRDLAAPCY